jgi:lipopolysaccharide transport system permease protein
MNFKIILLLLGWSYRMSKETENWDIIIKPSNSLLDFKISEILRYRDLLWIFVKRDIVTVYKQTILGPLWYLIQPILTTGMFTLVFGKIANISTEGMPHILFYLLGITFWNYFAECLTLNSTVFVTNQDLFGKVYFPRVITPLSIAISSLGKFIIQFALFLGIWIYFYLSKVVAFSPLMLLFPVIVFFMAIMSLGFGMIFSSLTTKYKDLTFLLTFGVQLWMYVTPVIYPLSTIPKKYLIYVKLNPMTGFIETIRHAFLGIGELNLWNLGYSCGFSILIFIIGFLIFNKIEKKFLDTV